MNGEQDGLWVVTVGSSNGSGSCPVAKFVFSGVEISAFFTKNFQLIVGIKHINFHINGTDDKMVGTVRGLQTVTIGESV
jgi:hypothetical protein